MSLRTKKPKKKDAETVERNVSDNDIEEIQSNAPTMAIFKLELEQVKGQNRLLKEEIRILEEETQLLKEQRDLYKEKASVAGQLLKEQRDLYKEKASVAGLAPVPKRNGSTSRGSQKKRSRESSVSSFSSASGSESEDDGRRRKTTNKKRRRRRHDDSPHPTFGKRVMTPEDVVFRYKKVLRDFRRHHSLPRTCESLGIDKNTIASTAVIADVLIAGEDGEFGEVRPIGKKQTLAEYAKVCKEFLDDHHLLQERIDQMRKANDLLTITYRFVK